MVEIGRGLGVRTVEELRAAAEAGRLGSLRGIGPQDGGEDPGRGSATPARGGRAAG